MHFAWLFALGLVWTVPQGAPQADRFARLIAHLHAAAAAGDRSGILALGSDLGTLADFSIALTTPTPTRLVIEERDRTATGTGAHRLLLEVFWQRGNEARLSTWTFDVVDDEGTLRVSEASQLASVTGLYSLALDPTRQFEVRNLTVRGPDLALHMSSGTAFVAPTNEGTTAVVLLGKGEMRFAPKDPAEQTQVRIFTRRDPPLVAPFDAAFIRIRPDDFETQFPAGTLVERPVADAQLKRAESVFDEYVGRTFHVDLTGLTGQRWSITPQAGDMIAEVRTRRYGTLTYTRSQNDAEDVTLFHRQRRRNISVYASAEKLATRGRFYSEDDLVDYDVLAYDLDAAITPDRQRIEGTARLTIRIRSASVTTLQLRLAERLVVGGVYSPDHGRLLHLRVVNQNSLIVSLPGTMVRGSELRLNIGYAGPLPPQELDREASAVQPDVFDSAQIPPEPRHLYSNRSYWYPQSAVTDYAMVKLAVTVPSGYEVVATGLRTKAPAPPADESGEERRHLRRFTFESDRPVRYVACVISNLRTLASTPTGATSQEIDDVPLHLVANPRQVGRARRMADRAADMFGYYATLIGGAPYPSFTLAFTEREVPGGHSPAYFAVVDQATQGLTSWRNDPVNFDSYPEFFIAHEIAHQWWGQAIGWKNYHEQWISEGFAQYFATLYAEERLTPGVATNVRRRMRQTAIDQSPKGPVYLGYRLGHVQADPRVFRSIVYNKAAMVLHMLRGIVGDEVFFRGVRAFYDEWKFRKAGTNDLRLVMERVSGRDLSAFFEGWIFGVDIPVVRFSHRTRGTRLVLRLEQRNTAMEFPVTVRVRYRSGRTEHRTVVATGKITEETLELTERIRSVDPNRDHGTLAIFR